jgi:hypothetical protein
VEVRYRNHLTHRKWITKYNDRLGEWLQDVVPVVEVLAEVPDDRQYDAERDITRQLRENHDLFNIKDGNAHSPESVKRIREGREKAKASREGSLLTSP